MKKEAMAFYAAVALAVTQSFAWAQGWPTKPVKVIVPFTPGGATDIMARIVSEKLAVQLGQPVVVVEPIPFGPGRTLGADGTNGASVVAKAEPDGHTILVHSSAYTATPSTYKHLPYDALHDLTGVVPLGLLPSVLVMAPSKGIRSVKELVDAAKARPGSMKSASIGIGSATHLGAERFRLGAGIEVVNVQFKGMQETLTQLTTGRVDYCFCPAIAALPFLKDGKLVALAVGNTKRSTALTNLPTTLEAGVANSDYNFWVGMFAPAKTPGEAISRLYRETVKALNLPDVREKLANLGAEPMDYNPEQFNTYLRNEIASNAALVKAAGIKAQ